MKFIRDYRQFIEVGCTSCNRKHTVQTDNYTISSEGYAFHSPIQCACGHIASTAIKDKRTWTTMKTEKNEMMKRNKATTIKLMLVIGFTIVFFAGEMVYLLSKNEAEQKSAQHDAEKESSSLIVVQTQENF